MSVNAFGLTFNKDRISVHDVSQVLMDVWNNRKCVTTLKEVINVLINKFGFDVNAAKDDDGNTVLDTECNYLVVTRSNLPIIRSLVEAGARPELKNDRQDLLKLPGVAESKVTPLRLFPLDFAPHIVSVAP